MTYAVILDANNRSSIPPSDNNNFKISADKTKIIVSASTPGVHTFFLLANSTVPTIFKTKEFQLTNMPCLPKVANIAAPSNFTGSHFYASFDKKKNEVQYNILKSTVKDEEFKAKKVTISLPVFSNPYPTLCPLKYILSSSDKESKLYEGLTVGEVAADAKTMGVEVKLSMEPTKYEFYVQAQNTEKVTAYTPKVVVNMNFCVSKLKGLSGKTEVQALEEVIYQQD